LFVATLMAFSLFVAACGSSSGGSSSSGGKLTQIVIASDFPLTGSARDQTVSMNKAIDMKLKEVNYKVGTVPIKFTPLDDATAQAGKWDEGKCTQNMTSLATDKQVVVMIGPMNSGCAQVQVKIANTAGLAMISPAATSVGLTKAGGDPGEPDKYYPNGVRNFLRTAMADDLQGKAAAKWAKDLGKTKAFVLNDKETYGKGLANQFIMAAKKDGIDVVGDEGIDPQAANYRDLMPKITAAHADVVFFGGIAQNNAGQILKDLRAADKSITLHRPRRHLRRRIPAGRWPRSRGCARDLWWRAAGEAHGRRQGVHRQVHRCQWQAAGVHRVRIRCRRHGSRGDQAVRRRRCHHT